MAEPTVNSSFWMTLVRARMASSSQMERAKPMDEISSSTVP